MNSGNVVQIIEPFITAGWVFGVRKFNFKAKRISKPSLAALLHSFFVLVCIFYIIRLHADQNVDGSYEYYTSYIARFWSPIQYIIISSLTFFVRFEQSEKLFSKLDRISSSLGTPPLNVVAQRKQNGAVVLILFSHTFGLTCCRAISDGWLVAGMLSYSSLVQLLEDIELCLFFALVRVLRCELGRLRADVKSWYSERAFVVSDRRERAGEDYVGVYADIAETFDTLVQIYSTQFMLTLVKSLVCSLILVQVVINDCSSGNGPSVMRACAICYWFSCILTRMFVISTACSLYHGELHTFKKTLVDVLVRGGDETRQEMAALLRVVHSTCSGGTTSVFKVFTLDNRLPFKFLSLLATYVIVLVQFANM